LLLGLPATGKTSFLAALWYLVQHPQVESRLRLEKFEGDNRYLNRVSQAWTGYELVPHTRLDSETVVSMLLKESETGRIVTVTFPDLSGESFTLQWTTRQYTQGYDKFLRDASGAILFITPLKYRKPIRIDMANPLVEEIIGGQETEQPLQDTSSPPVPWDPEKVPTQVELVELLQFICNRDYFKPPFRLVIIISAWDQLEKLRKSPSKWLNDTFPLLTQFLESNSRAFETAVYGISAQGGDYSETAKLAEMVPSERIQVTGPGVKNPHDLSEPLLWLIR
jgi:hypothetical protein